MASRVVGGRSVIGDFITKPRKETAGRLRSACSAEVECAVVRRSLSLAMNVMHGRRVSSAAFRPIRATNWTIC